MKGICTSLFILTGFFTFAQMETVPHQFWNNFSHFNPSYAGLEYQRQAGITFEGFRNQVFRNDYHVFYNQKLKKNFGIGVNANHMTSIEQTSEVSIPLSYDWNIKGKHHIAIGVAPSFRNYSSNQLMVDSTSIGLPTRNYFQTHTGITYKRGNLYAGVGIRNIHLQSWGDESLGPWKPHYYGHLSADIPFGSRSQLNNPHTMTLSALYTHIDGFNRIDLNANMQFEMGLNVLVGGRVRGGWTLGAGWDFFQNKLRGLYTVSWQRSKLSNGSSVQHGISLIYRVSNDD